MIGKTQTAGVGTGLYFTPVVCRQLWVSHTLYPNDRLVRWRGIVYPYFIAGKQRLCLHCDVRCQHQRGLSTPITLHLHCWLIALLALNSPCFTSTSQIYTASLNVTKIHSMSLPRSQNKRLLHYWNADCIEALEPRWILVLSTVSGSKETGSEPTSSKALRFVLCCIRMKIPWDPEYLTFPVWSNTVSEPEFEASDVCIPPTYQALNQFSKPSQFLIQGCDTLIWSQNSKLHWMLQYQKNTGRSSEERRMKKMLEGLTHGNR